MERRFQEITGNMADGGRPAFAGGTGMAQVGRSVGINILTVRVRSIPIEAYECCLVPSSQGHRVRCGRLTACAALRNATDERRLALLWQINDLTTLRC